MGSGLSVNCGKITVTFGTKSLQRRVLRKTTKVDPETKAVFITEWSSERNAVRLLHKLAGIPQTMWD
jgi:hypothetical protein